MPTEGPVLSKAPPTFRALERLLSCMVANVSYQRALLPESSEAELAYVGSLVAMRPLVNSQGVLDKIFKRSHRNPCRLFNNFLYSHKIHLGLVAFIASRTVVGSLV